MSALIFMAMWLVHRLPLSVLARLGAWVGDALWWLIPERRRVTQINLSLCFPEMSAQAREQLAREHFRAFARSFIEHALWWWAPKARIEQLVQLEGLEHLEACAGRPVIILAPHFVGLDAAFARLSCTGNFASMYAHQKNPRYDALLLAGRTRFGQQRLLSRQDGVRAVLRAMGEGLPFYYLPDLDFGPRDAIFVPFFGVPAATVTGVSRIARVTKAVVLPCVAKMQPGGEGYVAQLLPAWRDFPGTDVATDTQRVNAFIEAQVRQMPAQYFWLHKRFKTRPPGMPSFYPKD